MGILIVFVVLAIITWLFRFFGLKYYYKLQAQEAAIKKQKQKEFELIKASEMKSLEESGEELIAILTAACESVLSKGVVVRQIKFLRNANDSAWTRIGRLEVMSSHQTK